MLASVTLKHIGFDNLQTFPLFQFALRWRALNLLITTTSYFVPPLDGIEFLLGVFKSSS